MNVNMDVPEGARTDPFTAHLVAFARLLRAEGLPVTPGQVHDAARSLNFVHISERTAVHLALRATLVSYQTHFAAFDHAFDRFWREYPLAEAAQPAPRPLPEASSPMLPGDPSGEHQIASARSANGNHPDATAGGSDLLVYKDFAGYTADDEQRFRLLVQRLVPRLATEPGRRWQSGGRGEHIDLRRSLHRAGHYGGEVLDLRWRRRRIRKTRVILLCDVSGSMDRYSRHLIAFVHAMQHHLAGASTFVFSTRLYDVTRLLRTRTLEKALEQIAVAVPGWGAGTSIGHALDQFDRVYARERTNSRTVAIILSDGWERGDVETLRRAMAALRRRVRRILWLNPLLGAPDYRPLARGMSAALPYVDGFLPAHNLDSLERAGRRLTALSRSEMWCRQSNSAKPRSATGS